MIKNIMLSTHSFNDLFKKKQQTNITTTFQASNDSFNHSTTENQDDEIIDPQIEYEAILKDIKRRENTLRVGVLSAIAGACALIGGGQYLDNIDEQHYSYSSEPETEIYCNPKLIAKGGMSDSIAEPDEILRLLNYDALHNLPPLQQHVILSCLYADVTPIMLGKYDTKEKICEQVHSTQEILDYLVKEAKFPTKKSCSEEIEDYKRKYISQEEFFNQLDFSELLKYQKDMTLVKTFLSAGMDKIARNDDERSEKFDKTIEKGQKFINGIVHKYKMNAKIMGNKDFDKTITTSELSQLLCPSSLDGLTNEQIKEIYKNIHNSHLDVTFSQIESDDDAKEVNQRVGENFQKLQNQVDKQANQYRYQNAIKLLSNKK